MKKFTKKQWIKFSIAAVLYTLFAIWMQNLWLLLGLIVLVDIFLTHYIPWGAWKRSKNPAVRNVLEWVDDIVFALVAVYFINLFVFQNYQIPSSSLEKSLLVGDYLFVSKLSYGPRIPNTPISFPLVQNTLPSVLLDQGVVIRVLHFHGDRVACGEVEHYDLLPVGTKYVADL